MKNCYELQTKMQPVYFYKKALQFRAMFQKDLFSHKDFDEEV